MTDEQFAKLKNTVIAEVRKKHSKQPHPNHMNVLGKFIEAHLNRERIATRELAQRLGVPSIVIELMLRGDMPEWVLSDTFVDKLSQATGYESNVLRVMMRREISPTTDDNGDRKKPRRRARHSGQE